MWKVVINYEKEERARQARTGYLALDEDSELVSLQRNE
jgi:hypothetical protein